MYTYNAKILRVVDGDTYEVEVDLGFNVFTKQKIRLLGVNAPETKGKDEAEKKLGLEAKAWVETAIPLGTIVLLTAKGKDSFGRYLADIIIDGKNLADLLLENTATREYRAE